MLRIRIRSKTHFFNWPDRKKYADPYPKTPSGGKNVMFLHIFFLLQLWSGSCFSVESGSVLFFSVSDIIQIHNLDIMYPSYIDWSKLWVLFFSNPFYLQNFSYNSIFWMKISTNLNIKVSWSLIKAVKKK